MSDDAIEKILIDLLEDGLDMGDRGLRVKVKSYVKKPAQQIRQYVLDEIIGDDDKPLEYPMGKITDINGEQKQLIRQRSFDGDDARNKLRAEQRLKLSGKEEGK